MKGRTALLVSLAVLVVALLVVFAAIDLSRPPSASNPPPPPTPSSPCKESMGRGYALCLDANVVRVIDGDTLVIDRDTNGDGADDHIRLVLVDAPESYQAGGPEATAYLTSLCDKAHALVDEDDFQIGADPYGRILAVVTCAGTNSNAAMISSGFARTYFRFCSASEFQHEPWTGCP